MQYHQHLYHSYRSYKIESTMFGYAPNNVAHFAYLYFFTTTYNA